MVTSSGALSRRRIKCPAFQSLTGTSYCGSLVGSCWKTNLWAFFEGQHYKAEYGRAGLSLEQQHSSWRDWPAHPSPKTFWSNHLCSSCFTTKFVSPLPRKSLNIHFPGAKYSKCLCLYFLNIILLPHYSKLKTTGKQSLNKI